MPLAKVDSAGDMQRGEYKTPGGKLVGVTIRVDAAGQVEACHIDGDFFVEGDDDEARSAIADIESVLLTVGNGGGAAGHAGGGTGGTGGNGGVGVADIADIADAVAAAIGRHPGVRIIGTDADAIATAYARAVSGRRHARGQWRDSGRNQEGRQRREPSRQGHDSAETTEWRRRWAALRPAIIVDRPRPPAEQMAVDEQWAREVAQGRREPTVRFWQWASPAVVVGRFQSIPDEVHEDLARREGFDIVRRCTGGGAMFIEPGDTITYSLYAPLSFVAGVGIAESYELCDQWLIDALRAMGVDATFAGLNDIASSCGKIGGAAQRRFPGGAGSVLHHVTMAYDIDAERMSRILNVSAEKMSDKAVRSANKRVDPLRSQTGLSRDEIVARLVEHLRRLGQGVYADGKAIRI